MDALEAPALKRGALVAAACHGDPELHAEVMSLLAQHAEDTFLEPRAPDEPHPRIGTVIGGYRILSTLGEGGMGVVYLAEDVRLGRRAALKFLKTELVFHPQAKARFIREARAGATLDHPNICPLYGVDETSDGQLFLAMRFYEGETLKERLARGRLSIDTSLDIAAQMASGLGAAHRAGIVHRDVKPGNVLLVGDTVKIVDFGIAKIADESPLTIYGAAIGTATYMSPEQASGAAVDSRTDIWALGIVLYEMLTGGNVVAESVLAGLPPDLEDVVKRATRRRADERYPSMSELADALESFRRKTRDLPTLVLATAPRDEGSPPPPAEAVERLAVAVRLDGRILWSGDFDRGEILIGRSHDADVQLDDAEVSWTHALVQWHESGDISFTDRSSNGSFRNGIRIHETHLSSGDVISIPPFEIEWRVVGMTRDEDSPYRGTRIRGLPAHPPTERGATAPAPASQTAAMLRFVEGPAELVGRLIPLGHQRNTIGRARACDVRIDFPSISRHHATLAPSGPNRWRLEDAGSRNGVKVNGRLMPEPTLEIEVGDRVGLGADIVAVLELEATPNVIGTASPVSLRIAAGVSVFHPQVFVVRLFGVVEGSESIVLQDHVVRAIEAGHLLVILDFSGCARCDAAGFDVVVGLDVLLRRRAGALYLVGMRNDVKAAYRSRRLDRVLFSRDDEASAAAALARIVRTP